MAKTIATLLGIGFLLVGLVGFVAPNLLGAHLNTAHNLVHLITGAVSLYIGLKGTLSGARLFCLAFGAVYLLLGLVGYLLGTPGPGPEGVHGDRIWDLGILTLGRADHVIHLLLGAIYLIGGLLTRAYPGRAVNRT
jgi:hypothetical protein